MNNKQFSGTKLGKTLPMWLLLKAMCGNFVSWVTCHFGLHFKKAIQVTIQLTYNISINWMAIQLTNYLAFRHDLTILLPGTSGNWMYTVHPKSGFIWIPIFSIILFTLLSWLQQPFEYQTPEIQTFDFLDTFLSGIQMVTVLNTKFVLSNGWIPNIP